MRASAANEGRNLLFIGPFGMLNAQFGWLATPCLIFAISAALSRQMRPGRLGTICVLIVMLLALADAIAWHDYPNDAARDHLWRMGWASLPG